VKAYDIRQINRPLIDVLRDPSGFVLRKVWVVPESAVREELRYVATIIVQSVDNDGPQGGINIGFEIEEPLSTHERLLWNSVGKRVLLTYSTTRAGYHKVIEVTTEEATNDR
jgi:hypothetical protein